MNYIGVAGKNGFGVFDSERRLVYAKEYLTKASSRKFNSFLEAFCYARDVYNDWQDEYDNAFLVIVGILVWIGFFSERISELRI